MESINKKKTYIQMLRIIACVLVIYNHTYSYYQFGLTTGLRQYIFMVLTMLTRINVPIFLMITGGLLLAKEEAWNVVFKKRFMRILYVLLLFECMLFLLSDSEVNIWTFIRMFLQNSIPEAFPYWYMYSLLGLLLVLPFIQRIAKGINKTEVIAIIVLHFIIMSLLPILNLILQVNQQEPIMLSQNFSIPFAVEQVWFYPLIGYYIEHQINIHDVKAKHILALIMLALTGIILSTICTFEEADILGDYSQNYVDLFSFVTAIVIYVLIKWIFIVGYPNLETGKISKYIRFIGSLTLGIYMLEPCIKALLYSHYESLVNIMFNRSPEFLVASIMWIAISFILGAIITGVLKQLPLLSKLL